MINFSFSWALLDVNEHGTPKTPLMSLTFRINGLHFSFSASSFRSAGQRNSSQQLDTSLRQADPWNEIDRRNQHVLYPLNAKETYGASHHLRKLNYSKSKLSSQSFTLESFHTSPRRRRSSPPPADDQAINDSSNSCPKLQDKRLTGPSTNHEFTFVYGNSIIKSNKAGLLHLFESDDQLLTYVNKYGVIIGIDGPFWPQDYRILHATPRLLSRELTPKEFYLPTNSPFSSSM